MISLKVKFYQFLNHFIPPVKFAGTIRLLGLHQGLSYISYLQSKIYCQRQCKVRTVVCSAHIEEKWREGLAPSVLENHESRVFLYIIIRRGPFSLIIQILCDRQNLFSRWLNQRYKTAVQKSKSHLKRSRNSIKTVFTKLRKAVVLF